MELEQACERLKRAGIPPGNYSILLAGVNDNVRIRDKIIRNLVLLRKRPYYLYPCDLIEGTGASKSSEE